MSFTHESWFVLVLFVQQDKGIRAVKRANEYFKSTEGSYKYHIVTGAAGTVSPSE